jgi:flagellar biogenesis protein FliO
MRIVSLLIAQFSFATVMAQATGTFGTKRDVITASSSTPSAPPTGMALVQLLLVLIVVVFLFKWALPKAMSKFNRTLSPRFDGKLRVLDTIPFASGSLQVVEVCDRRLLLSVHSMGVSCLADLTPGQEKSAPTESPQAFFELVDSLTTQSEEDLRDRAINTEAPAPTRVERAYGVTPATPADPVQSRRARIARLTGGAQ